MAAKLAWETLWQYVLLALAHPQVKFILFGIAADVLANIAASLVTGEFRLFYVANFIKTKLLPYLIGYIAVCIVVQLQPEMSAWDDAVWAFIMLALIGDVLAALEKAGVPLPEAFSKD